MSLWETLICFRHCCNIDLNVLIGACHGIILYTNIFADDIFFLTLKLLLNHDDLRFLIACWSGNPFVLNIDHVCWCSSSEGLLDFRLSKFVSHALDLLLLPTRGFGRHDRNLVGLHKNLCGLRLVRYSANLNLDRLRPLLVHTFHGLKRVRIRTRCCTIKWRWYHLFLSIIYGWLVLFFLNVILSRYFSWLQEPSDSYILRRRFVNRRLLARSKGRLLSRGKYLGRRDYLGRLIYLRTIDLELIILVRL